jgi:hypothetical protein
MAEAAGIAPRRHRGPDPGHYQHLVGFQTTRIRRHAFGGAAMNRSIIPVNPPAIVRTDVDLKSQIIRALWHKTLPHLDVTSHCDRVRNPIGMANYVVKHLKDSAKKELPPEGFRGRIYSYSRAFFTKQVASLWLEQRQEWYPPGRTQPA